MNWIGDIADDALRAVEGAQAQWESLFEPTIRLGVTGLSRAGKTVFITSLVANLLARGRMTLLEAEAQGRIVATMLRPQPDQETPRFDYEDHLVALSGPEPRWPESTRSISQLRVSIRFRPTGLISGLRGDRVLHLDIVDYPGEWLLDLPLMNQSYAQWAAGAIEAARRPARSEHAAMWLAWLGEINPASAADEAVAREGAARFTRYLDAAREAGLSGVAPGRFLMPGDHAGAPLVTFSPLKAPEARARAGSLWRLMEERFEAYKRRLVRPFFRDHFARLDRQVVLVDALSAINAGPEAVADLREAMADILECFRPGENSWLSALTGRRVERILFAATKADHIHSSQHARLAAILSGLLREAMERAAWRGAGVEAMAIAALRATTEREAVQGGGKLPCVVGRVEGRGTEAVLYPGELPEDPREILRAARRTDGDAPDWLAEDYAIMRFAPPRLAHRPGEGPPHIRLDRALQFLLGDRLL